MFFFSPMMLGGSSAGGSYTLTTNTVGDYSTVTHDGDFNPTDVANFWGFAWTPDGNTLVVSTTAGDMRAYAVPTAFDITSIVTTTATANCAVGSGTYGFDFNDSGNIVAANLDQTPKLVSFSTAYDISTFTGTSVMSTLSTSTQATSEFADNGNYWLTATFQGAAVLHSLSTPYDLSTAGTTTTLDGNTQDAEETCYSISPNGKQVIMIGRQNDYAHFYTLGTNWDLSTATYDGQMPLLLDSSQPNTVHWSPDMTKFWITGSAVHHIRQYSVSLSESV